MIRPYAEVDVFCGAVFRGNPVAVVLDAEGLTTDEMHAFARWTNLSETTFVLSPEDPSADYRVRIFTPTEELPFAGHPTLGTCRAWREYVNRPPGGSTFQECGAGIVEIRSAADGLEFAAPDARDVPAGRPSLAEAAASVGLPSSAIIDMTCADNGPTWLILLVRDASAVLAARPGRIDRQIGLVGAYPVGQEAAFEVRAFVPQNGGTAEDPVTGSLNAMIGEWFLRTGRTTGPFMVSQGTAIGRRGRVNLSGRPGGGVWVGGQVETRINGTVRW